MPLLRVLLRQGEILCPVGDAWLDHCALIPLIERCNSDPTWVAGDCGVPAGAVGRTIVAWDYVGSDAAGDAGIVVAGDHAGRPDFIGLVCAVVGVNLVAEALVHGGHIAVLDAPVAAAEEMDAVKDAEHVHIHALGGPDHLVIWINLAANVGPLCYRAPVAEGVPEEDHWLALPVEEVWIVAVVRVEVAQGGNHSVTIAQIG